MGDDKMYSIGELAQLVGESQRTIHYYIQLGLVHSPVGKGRGSRYSNEHLERILQIQSLKRDGLSLEQIKQYQEGDEIKSGDEQPLHQLPTRIRLAEGIHLEVSHNANMPTPAKLEKLIELCHQILGSDNNSDKRTKITIFNKLDSILVIPNALEDNASLCIAPEEKVEVDNLTPALKKTEREGLIKIVTK